MINIVSGHIRPETSRNKPVSVTRQTFQHELQLHLPTLRRVALGLTRNSAAADDLTQDCAERALRKQALYVATTAGMKPWLMTMMVNLHRNQIRAGKSRPQTDSMDLEFLKAASPDTLAARLDLTDTACAIDQLPNDQREVLLTVVLGGMSYKDAAETLSLPVGTLMSRLGRARARLREITNEGAV